MNYDLIYKFSPTFTKMMDMIGQVQAQVNPFSSIGCENRDGK